MTYQADFSLRNLFTLATGFSGASFLAEGIAQTFVKREPFCDQIPELGVGAITIVLGTAVARKALSAQLDFSATAFLVAGGCCGAVLQLSLLGSDATSHTAGEDHIWLEGNCAHATIERKGGDTVALILPNTCRLASAPTPQ